MLIELLVEAAEDLKGARAVLEGLVDAVQGLGDEALQRAAEREERLLRDTRSLADLLDQLAAAERAGSRASTETAGDPAGAKSGQQAGAQGEQGGQQGDANSGQQSGAKSGQQGGQQAGAQGEHKIKRGFLPVVTHSAHFIVEPQLHDAIGRAMGLERREVEHEVESGRIRGPFKESCVPPHPLRAGVSLCADVSTTDGA